MIDVAGPEDAHPVSSYFKPVVNTTATDSSESDQDVMHQQHHIQEEKDLEQILKDDFSFDIKSDLLGVAYKNKSRSNKHKYMGQLKPRDNLVDSSDIYQNLSVDHQITKLPELPKPLLLKVSLKTSLSNTYSEMSTAMCFEEPWKPSFTFEG